MSFSYQVRGASKADAMSKAVAEMAKVIEAQPVHAHDADSVQAVVETYVGLLPEPSPEQDVVIGISGSLEWQFSEMPVEAPLFVGASVQVSARLLVKE